MESGADKKPFSYLPVAFVDQVVNINVFIFHLNDRFRGAGRFVPEHRGEENQNKVSSYLEHNFLGRETGKIFPVPFAIFCPCWLFSYRMPVADTIRVFRFMERTKPVY